MKATQIHVAHAIPGRIRLKIDRLKGDATLAQTMRERVRSLPGVQHVETNATTGSLLVLYDEGVAGWSEHQRPLVQTVASMWGLRPDEVRRHLAHPSNGHWGARAIRPHHVKGFFSSLNEQVESVTGGVGLTLLVPLALVLLGIRGALVADRVPAPRWYDLLWFGFAAFLMLNVAGVPAGKAAEEAAEVAAAL